MILAIHVAAAAAAAAAAVAAAVSPCERLLDLQPSFWHPAAWTSACQAGLVPVQRAWLDKRSIIRTITITVITIVTYCYSYYFYYDCYYCHLQGQPLFRSRITNLGPRQASSSEPSDLALIPTSTGALSCSWRHKGFSLSGAWFRV